MQLFVAEVASFQFEKWSFLHSVFFAVCSGLGSKALETSLFWADATWCGGRPFRFGRIPAGGKVRQDDELPWIDMLYGGMNKFVIAPIYLCAMAQHIQQNQFDYSLTLLTPVWALAQLLAAFFIYDLMYAPLHRLAHVRCLYAWIHKHHHRQLVPYRGTYDAVNEHPVELFVGAHIHIVALQGLQAVLGALGSLLGSAWQIHILALGAFLVASPLLGSLNHTRFDVSIPNVFAVRDHDTHHRVFTTNYGQYTMWVDRLMGTYQQYSNASASKSA